MADAPDSLKTLEDTFRKYAWDYFALHADHRLRAFHFYIILSTTIIGAFGLLLKNGEVRQWMSAFGFLLIFFSFVFWKLDNRTRQLIKIGEAAIKHLDAQHGLIDEKELPHPLRIFEHEEVISTQKKLFPLMSGHFSYARCFRWVFGMFSLVGLAIFATCLYASAA